MNNKVANMIDHTILKAFATVGLTPAMNVIK